LYDSPDSQVKEAIMNLLCQFENIICEYILKKSRPSIHVCCQASTMLHRGSWPDTSNIVA